MRASRRRRSEFPVQIQTPHPPLGESTPMKKQGAVLSILAICFTLTATESPAMSRRALCFDSQFSEFAVAHISDQSAPELTLLDVSRSRKRIATAEPILSFFRSLSGEWLTPTSVWSTSASQLSFKDEHSGACDIYIDDSLIYALIDKDTGFLSYEMTPSEKLALDRLLESRGLD